MLMEICRDDSGEITMDIKALGFVSAQEAPPGSLIAYPNGTIIVVSEYSTHQDNTTLPRRNAYIVGSGEYYCGSITDKGMLIEIDTQFRDVEEMD
jgi:hypothetical protein